MNSRVIVGFSVLALCLSSFSPSIAEESQGTWRSLDGVRVLAPEDSKYTSEGGHLLLQEGDVIVDSADNAVLRTAMSVIDAKKKSLLFARVGGGHEHFFVLLGTVVLDVDHHKTMLNAGDEAIVSDKDLDYHTVTRNDQIGRRRVRIVKLHESRSVAFSEFSLIQAVEREPLLYRLVHSRDDEGRALRARLIKMAAVLNIVTSRHGQYVTGRH